MGDLQPNEGRGSILWKKTNTLNPSGLSLWRPLLGPRGRAHLSRQIDEILVFIAILDKHVAKM